MKKLLEKVSSYFDDLETYKQEDQTNIKHTQQSSNISATQNNNFKDNLSQSIIFNSNNNNIQSSNTKKNISIFESVRSKSFIMNAASDAFNNLLGNKNQNTKVLTGNSQSQYMSSNQTQRKKKAIIAYPNIEEKKACMQILSTCTQFLNQVIISQITLSPIYKNVKFLFKTQFFKKKSEITLVIFYSEKLL